MMSSISGGFPEKFFYRKPPPNPLLAVFIFMKVIISESQYVTIMEDIKKERYKQLVSDLLETLFGKLSITDTEDFGEIIQHTIYNQDGEDIAYIYLGRSGNTGCKKDLTLSRDVTEKLEGYIPYFRHKIFSKVLK